jgi:hypothetical protein
MSAPPESQILTLRLALQVLQRFVDALQVDSRSGCPSSRERITKLWRETLNEPTHVSEQIGIDDSRFWRWISRWHQRFCARVD